MSAAGGNECECVGRHGRPGPGSSLTLGWAGGCVGYGHGLFLFPRQALVLEFESRLPQMGVPRAAIPGGWSQCQVDVCVCVQDCTHGQGRPSRASLQTSLFWPESVCACLHVYLSVNVSQCALVHLCWSECLWLYVRPITLV